MAEASPLEEDLHRSLIERLSQLEIAAALHEKAQTFSGPGLFIGLLGFEDGDRDGASAECGAELQRRGLLRFSRPIGAGGLLVALAACCLPLEAGEGSMVGCAVVLPAPRHVGAGEPPSVFDQLFHESPGRFIVCLPADKQTDARLVASDHGVPLWPLGRTGGRELVVRASDAGAGHTGGSGFKEVVRLPIAALVSASRDGSL